MKGLWSQQFPPTDSPPPATPLTRYERCLICPSCNTSTCRLLTSSTTGNPGRQFYTCPAGDHKFFKWADEVKPDELINVPYCGGCMAGVCRVRREIRGPNAGRILFMCRVKEGEGSCGYRVWQDELETSANAQADERRTSCQSTLTNCDDTLPVNDDLAEGSRENDLESTVILSQTGPTSMTNCNNNGPATMTDYNDSGPAGNSNYTSLADDESPVIHNLRDLECVGVTSETTNESSRKPPKRSRYGDLKARGSSISAHPLMLSLGVNSESIKPCWMAAAIRKNLSAQLKGWWGRLVFHPRPCLMTHSPRPFTCCITSPLDSTFVVQDKIPVNSGASTIPTMNLPRIASCSKSLFTSCHNAQLSGIKPFCVSVNSPSCSEPLCDIRFQNVMSKSISEAFGQAAEHLQNELLTHLETMDVKDHEAMRQAAEATFAALDRLLFDHQDFKARANELIHCATLLANIEESMPRNNSYQKLVDQCSSERMRLDEINSFHAKAVDTMTDNKKRLKVLQEEISSTMDWIFQIEAELSSCEIEMLKMEHELDEISKNKEVLEGKFLIASKALEESQKLRQLKEAEWNAAKATYDRARMLLRG
ncbi:uncharacterized protein LOC105165107 isoform X1 [Sesamum indicum]|uniref:Uncharacterized protein LOC105165107 isoform X1 n=1 Tax=Sesamum indicum TaxID=4182 RepID=A0A6I9TH66_SESIN|nr:uncharacterized protein LOC105165107 isoform X1 [Sesamum indicum]